MDDGRLRAECESLAERLDLEIRPTADGPSGLCKVRGRRVLFIESGMDDVVAIDVFIRAFRTLDLEGVFIIPAIRDRIDGEL